MFPDKYFVGYIMLHGKMATLTFEIWDVWGMKTAAAVNEEIGR